MAADDRFTFDRRKVVSETVEDEVIVIHLDTGNYYSLTGPGAEIWNLATASHSVAEIAGALHPVYDEDAGVLEQGVAAFVDQLVQERLLFAGGEDPGRPATLAARNGSRTAFAPPALEKYEDMQDFLLVDPIHEVDDAGWPSART